MMSDLSRGMFLNKLDFEAARMEETWRQSDEAIRTLIAREIWRYNELPYDFDEPGTMIGDLAKKMAIDQAECIRKVILGSPVLKARLSMQTVNKS
jgi:hypothetical protein